MSSRLSRCAAAALLCLFAAVAAAGSGPDGGDACPRLPTPLPTSVEDLRAALGEGRTLGPSETRKLYRCLVNGAGAAQEAAGEDGAADAPLAPEEVECDAARASHGWRKVARQYARERGGALSEAFVRLRDYLTYGSGDGPTFESLVERYSEGAAGGAEACRRVRRASRRTNAAVDGAVDSANHRRLGLAVVAVGVLFALAVLVMRWRSKRDVLVGARRQKSV